ncbi:MAG: dTDP-4-dehydrorhamnose 3,5-epimerase [Thermosipho sp. (in: thermotogales)]|jgi:dTDP-4-dehydrorhamnose 3,5-epimerase|nr:dTDP-4-dehydrorhamnose 3,5-epimerase [Thermosipho sp. (in: thermotogales)]MDK2900129.1 dTDP-4-dehydrorhamnose 3,5-epimerase [Thermosipho sp. (in: thermotogales)]
MKFEKIETELEGVYIIKPSIFVDNRGWFMESYNYYDFKIIGINIIFIQDNHSYTAKKGTIRGIHFQINPKAQTKLVRCTKGKILDIAVDLRKGSPTYKKWIAIELSEENKNMLLIPKGFGHAFLTLKDNVEVQYKVDEYYSKEHDRSIRYDDPEININWDLEKYGIEKVILSEKDKKAPFLKDSDVNFIWSEKA